MTEIVLPFVPRWPEPSPTAAWRGSKSSRSNRPKKSSHRSGVRSSINCAENDYDSVRALARALDRDKGHVSRDLGVLSEHAIVIYETDGRSKSPRLTQEHLVVEPIA